MSKENSAKKDNSQLEYPGSSCMTAGRPSGFQPNTPNQRESCASQI